MKKKFKLFFKKTFCLLLAVLILTSSFPIQVFAVDGFDEYGLSWLFDEDPIIIDINGEVDEFLDLSKDYFNGIEKFSDSESIQGMAKQIDSIAKTVGSVTPLLTAFQYVSYATSAVNNIIGILQSLGIMKNAQESKYENILKSLDELKKGVEEINTKVTKMQDNLDKNFANLTFGQDQEAARDAQEIWSNFIKNEYGTMTKYMDYYENLVNTESIKVVETWKTNNKTTLRAIYNDSGLLLLSSSNYNGFNKEIPDTPKRSDDTSNSHIDNVVAHEILLPGKYISYNDDVNADNYEEAMRSTIRKGVISAMKTKDIDVNKLSYLGFDASTPESEVIDKVTEDLLNSVIYEIASLCAESKQDGDVSFAQTVLTAYKQYCGAISGKNDSNSSLYNALKYLTLTYPFHGDVKKYAGSYYSMVGMSIIEFGTFTSTLVASTTSMSKQTKTDLVALTSSTLSKTNDIYASVIKIKDGDKYYDRNDNYCYPLNAEISYVDVSAQTVSWSDTYYRYANATGGRSEWSDKHDDYVDWTIVDSSLKLNTDNIDVYRYEAKRSEDNLTSSMLDSESMQYLYHYIQTASAGRDIKEYLKENKVIKDDNTHSSVLLLPDYKIEKQSLDKSLKVYLYGNDFKKIDEHNDDKYVEKYVGLSNGTPIKNGDFKTLASTKIIGDTFDIEGSVESVTSSTEASDKITKGVTLGTRIIQFYEGGFATPHYLFHDKANVSVDVSASATDNREFYEAEAYRSMYTAKVEKSYGMLVKNYSPNSYVPKASVNIKNKNDFLDFIEEIAEGKDYSNTVIKLSADIDLKDVDFEDYWPKSLSSREFKGHFNGNGKTISNLTIESSGNRVALFRTTGENAKIENLKLKNFNITGTGESKGAAALVGYANGRLLVDNVEVINGTITGYKYVAGIVGEARENTKVNILNSKNSANITSNNTDAGGIIGNTGNYYIKGALNTGDITAKRGAAGGISGYSGSDSKADSSFVRDSENTGVITGYDCAGGISGHIESDNRFSRFFNNTNRGAVTVTNKGSAGGIVGYTEAGGSYIDNFNEGTIISKDRYAGGILGENEDDLILIRNNTNKGNVTGVNKSGGIAGYLGDKDYDCIVILESNKNSGIIESTSKDTGDAGGIVGSIYTDNKKHSVKDNSNTGKVTAARQAGGIIGYMAGGGLFDSNSNKATITSTTQNAGGIVGKIEDDKCTFKGSSLGKTIIGSGNTRISPDEYDYIIKAEADGMHAGKICGWDGYRKSTVNSDSLVATIFGEGNLLTIIILLLVLGLGGFAFYKYQNKNNVKLKRKSNKKVEKK